MEPEREQELELEPEPERERERELEPERERERERELEYMKDPDYNIYYGTRDAPNPYEFDADDDEIHCTPPEREPYMFDLRKQILDATYDRVTQQGMEFNRRSSERRKVTDHPALAEILIEKLETQTKLQAEVIKLLEAAEMKAHEETLILVRRLAFEDMATFATETYEVMRKYRDEAMKP